MNPELLILERIATALERLANVVDNAVDLQERVQAISQVNAKTIPCAPNTDRGWHRLVAMQDASVWTWPEGEAYMDDAGIVVKLYATPNESTTIPYAKV